MDVLVGSRALNYRYRKPSSEVSDWDIISPYPKKHYLIDNLSFNEETNKTIFNKMNNSNDKKIITSPVGPVIVATLEILKVLKLSSVQMKSLKHSEDIKRLEDIELDTFHLDLLKKRISETERRIELQEFFTNEVYRLFRHDDLHKWIVEKSPTFNKIIKENSSVLGSKIKFKNLNREEKLNLISEELFVFSLERNLIPQLIKNKSSVKLSLDFFSAQNLKCPLYYWIDKFGFDNGVVRYPTYISKFIRENKEEVLLHSISMWSIYLNRLPVSFWKKIFD
jgi:hypothetical protein